MSTKEDVLHEKLSALVKEMKEAGTYKRERVITSSQSAQITVQESEDPVLNFCANNYLGLANHPELVAAAKETLDSHGFGLSSVRFICGTQDIHKKLEKAIAEFHKTEDTILFASCFDANGGVFEAILGPEDAVISDTLNHASIIDGVRLCKAKRFRYKHMDMEDLEEQLKAADAAEAKVKLVVTDGVFSMDGDVAPLKGVRELADKYGALVMIDECHATGFFGETGRGTPEYFGLEGKIDIITSTLGKALGGATGGYVTGRADVIEILRQKGRPYLFSNSVAPCVVGASLKVYEMLTASSERVQTLAENTALFRSRMKEAGFEVLGNDKHPIAPILLRDARVATEFADLMLKKGIYVIGFSFPVVPRGQARIRVQLSAAHSKEQINRAVDAFIEIGKQLGVIH